jgi:hypothetical protein
MCVCYYSRALLTCPTCSSLSHFASPCLVWFALTLPHFALLCFALPTHPWPCLPYLWPCFTLPTLGHAYPTLGHACFAYPWLPLVTLHLGQIKYYKSKVTTKGVAIGVVPFASELVKHEKVVLISNNVCPTTLKHQIAALPFFKSYLLPSYLLLSFIHSSLIHF